MRLFLALIALAVTATAGFGQEVVAPEVSVVTGVVPVTWWQSLQETLLSAFLAVSTVVIPMVGMYARRYLGQRGAQVLQAMLQAAAERAAGKVIAAAPAGTSAEKMPISVGTDYLNTTMKGTIAELGVTPQSLIDIVVANIGKLLALNREGKASDVPKHGPVTAGPIVVKRPYGKGRV